MPAFREDIFNPNPGTKLIVTLIMGMSLMYQRSDLFNFLFVLVFAIFFVLNKHLSTGIKVLLFYSFLLYVVNNANFEGVNFKGVSIILKMFLAVIPVIKIFFLPILAGKFLLQTSEVSSIISSMDKLKFPKSISIPIAVMFRFFPSYKEERSNIKLAMKMRGITHKNPFRYMEYVSVPLLISSSNIADDISKAAETKCIADPCKKVRYRQVKIQFIDFLFIFLIILIHIGGRIYG